MEGTTPSKASTPNHVLGSRFGVGDLSPAGPGCAHQHQHVLRAACRRRKKWALGLFFCGPGSRVYIWTGGQSQKLDGGVKFSLLQFAWMLGL